MNRLIRRTKYPRRHRPQYPTVAAGDAPVLIERTECGTNVELKTEESAKRGRRIIKRCFVFMREIFALSRSKYAPHVGKKQLGAAT